jgi:hypothetical protein
MFASKFRHYAGTPLSMRAGGACHKSAFSNDASTGMARFERKAPTFLILRCEPARPPWLSQGIGGRASKDAPRARRIRQ